MSGKRKEPTVGQWRVVRGRPVSLADVEAEYRRRHPEPVADASYEAARAELLDPSRTVAVLRVDRGKPIGETLPRGRTAAALDKLRQGADRHRTRAAELRRDGLSVPQIGIRMAQEERRDRPYSERTVHKWLSAAGAKKE